MEINKPRCRKLTVAVSGPRTANCANTPPPAPAPSEIDVGLGLSGMRCQIHHRYAAQGAKAQPCIEPRHATYRSLIACRKLHAASPRVTIRSMQDDGWKQLETLRLILAFVVAIGHAVGIFAHPFGVVSESFSGALSFASEVAVGIFFLTSGLVIGRSLISKSANGNW